MSQALRRNSRWRKRYADSVRDWRGFVPQRQRSNLALMLTEATDYATLYRDFRWDVPARFNIATACCDRHADGSGRLALIYVDEDGGVHRTSFDEMRALSSSFANVLKADGLSRGDRVAV